MQRLSSQYDDINAKIRALSDSFGGLSTELDYIKTIQGRMARSQGLDEEEE